METLEKSVKKQKLAKIKAFMDIGRKLNVRKTFRRRSGHFLSAIMYIHFMSFVQGVYFWNAKYSDL